MENKNQPKVLIVGESSEAKTALINEASTSLHLITKEAFIDLRKQLEQEEVVFSYSRPKEVDINFATPYSTKEFVCKGKHQYREVREQEGVVINTKWVCQCGRSL